MDYIDWIISSFIFLLMVGLVLLTISKNISFGENDFLNAQSIYKSVVENVEIYNVFKNETEITPYLFKPQNIMGKSQNLFLVKDGVYYGVLKEKDKFIHFFEEDSYYWKEIPVEIALEENQKLRLDITDIETMALWLDASVLEDELEDGELVSVWEDKSGNGRNATQNDDINKPIFKVDKLNGKPTILFDGEGTFLSTPSLQLTDDKYSIITVFKNEKNGISGVWAFNCQGIHSINNNFFWRGNGQGYNSVIFNDFTNNVFLINTIIKKSGTIMATLDLNIYSNTNNNTGKYGNNNNTFSSSNNIGLYIGKWCGSNSFGGELAEIIVFNNPLTSEERLLVENYLSQKYDILVDNGIEFFDNHIDIYDEKTNQKETTIYFLDTETKEPVSCNYTFKNKKIIVESCESDAIVTSKFYFNELNNAFVNNEPMLGILVKEESFNDYSFINTFNVVPDTNVNTGILELKEPSTLTTLKEYYDYYGFLSTNNFINVYVSYTDENNNFFCKFGDSSIVIGKTENNIETILKTTSYAKTSEWHKVYFGYTNDNVIVCEAGEIKNNYQEETNIPKTNIVITSAYDNTLIDDFFIFLNNDIKVTIEQQNIKGNYIDCNVNNNNAKINLLDFEKNSSLDINFSKTLNISDSNGITIIKTNDGENKIAMFPQTKEFWLFKDENEEINIGVDENTEFDLDISDLENQSLWLDASVLNLNDGELVSIWEDKSGNENDGTQTVTESKPTFKTNILNGKPVVRFNNSHYFLLPNNLSTNLDGKSGITILIVTNKTKHNQRNSFLDLTIDGTNSKVFLDIINNSFRSGGRSVATDSFQSATTTEKYINENYYLFSTTQDLYLNKIATWTNGKETSNETVNYKNQTYLGTGTKQTIGCAAGLINFLQGNIAEILIFNEVLSNENKILVENYLSQKYAIDVENGIEENTTSISLRDSVSFKEKIKIEFLDKETEKPISCNYSFKNKIISIKNCDANAIVKIKYNFDELKTIPETKKTTITKTTHEVFFKNKIETLTEQAYYLRVYNKTLNLENKNTKPSSNNYKNFTKLLWSNAFLEEINIEIKE